MIRAVNAKIIPTCCYVTSRTLTEISQYTPSVVRTTLDLGAEIYFEKLIPFYQSTRRHIPDFWCWAALLYMRRTQYFGCFIVLKSYTTSQRFRGFPVCFFSLEILYPKDEHWQPEKPKTLFCFILQILGAARLHPSYVFQHSPGQTRK
jgi:hypothetical protein